MEGETIFYSNATLITSLLRVAPVLWGPNVTGLQWQAREPFKLIIGIKLSFSVGIIKHKGQIQHARAITVS